MSTVSVQVTQGPIRHSVSISIDNDIGTLKSILHEKTGIPPEVQKLIFKGRHLQNDAETIASVGIKEGSRLMVIGKKIDPAHDEHVGILDEIKGQVSAIQRKLITIEQELEGVEKGFLNGDLVSEKCSKLNKQCLSCNESLMQLLEKLDSVVPLANDTQIRLKRKSIVVETQKLLSRTDELNIRIKLTNEKYS